MSSIPDIANSLPFFHPPFKFPFLLLHLIFFMLLVELNKGNLSWNNLQNDYDKNVINHKKEKHVTFLNVAFISESYDT